MTVRANEDTREAISLSRTLFIIHIHEPDPNNARSPLCWWRHPGSGVFPAIVQILSILFIDVNSLPSSSNWVRVRGRALVAGIRLLTNIAHLFYNGLVR